VHGTLDAAQRAEVEAHLATCADARRELMLVRDARDAIVRRTPVVDPAAVAAAIRASRGARDARPVLIISRRVAWRIAAAIAILATGAFGYWLGTQRSGSGAGAPPDNVARAPKLVPAPLAPESNYAVRPNPSPKPVTPPTPPTTLRLPNELSVPDGVSDLSAAQTGAILNDLEKGNASFETEPLPDFDLGSGL
jgi:hypothetical protein